MCERYLKNGAVAPKGETVPEPSKGLCINCNTFYTIKQYTHLQRKAFVALLSPAKFRPYRAVFGGDEMQALELYLFNIEISSILQKSLGIFEVFLKEKINQQLNKKWGNFWFSNEEFRNIIGDLGMLKLNQAFKRAKFVPKHIYKNSKKANYVINELHFGFLTSLFSKGTRNNYEQTLWNPSLNKIFTNMERIEVLEKLNSLRYTRNRISHNDSIIFGIPQHGQTVNKKPVRKTLASVVKDLQKLEASMNLQIGSMLITQKEINEIINSVKTLKALEHAMNLQKHTHIVWA